MKQKQLYVRKNWQLYVFFLMPALVFTIIFKYLPMGGILMALEDYNVRLGLLGSEWVGLDYFRRFLSSPDFMSYLLNTLKLSLYGLLWGFPMPIILALLLNQILGTSTNWMTMPEAFRTTYIASGIWQGAGWASIMYTAALSNVSKELEEAAMLDGANVLQQIWYVQLPAIKNIIVIQFILSAGNIMSVGFEKAYALQTGMNLPTSEIISTYVYKIGLLNGGDEMTEAPAFLNENTIETTGAGDTFMGCMLHQILKKGYQKLSRQDMEEMLVFANAAASIITTRRGALRVMPEQAEIEELFKD